MLKKEWETGDDASYLFVISAAAKEEIQEEIEKIHRRGREMTWILPIAGGEDESSKIHSAVQKIVFYGNADRDWKGRNMDKKHLYNPKDAYDFKLSKTMDEKVFLKKLNYLLPKMDIVLLLENYVVYVIYIVVRLCLFI